MNVFYFVFVVVETIHSKGGSYLGDVFAQSLSRSRSLSPHYIVKGAGAGPHYHTAESTKNKLILHSHNTKVL